MRILVIIPITGLTKKGIEERLDHLRSIARPGTEVDIVQIEDGPPAIESRVDHVQAGPEILKYVKRAEEEGYDAAIIWCGGDPALEAARQIVDIPVIGPGESMRLFASMLGRKPCGVTPSIPVLEMRRDMEKTAQLIKEGIEERMRRREGDAFYLGCLALWGFGKRLRKEMDLPVIDGAEASLKMAEVAVELGLFHSRVSYPKYPPHHRRN